MQTTSKRGYLEQIKAGLKTWLEIYDAQIERWRKSIDLNDFFGYQPPSLPIHCAVTEAFLYSLEKNKAYAERARERLISYRQFTKAYPEDYKYTHPEYENGLPPINSIFLILPYLQAYLWIKDSGVLSPGDHKAIESTVADSLSALFRFPEWGAHNRAAYRAAGLAAASLAFPNNPEASNWAQMARVLASDSIGNWSIEDSSSYHLMWLFAMIWYIDLTGRSDFFNHVTTRYYFDYFVSLLTPAGWIPDFGDSNWGSNWTCYIACMERGAKEYQDPKMRYAACKVYDRMIERNGKSKILGSPYDLIAAYLWMDENIAPEKPTFRSQEVLDDLVGKKIIFRSGWEDDSTFLLLNYKPETDYGYTPREYLKNTIPVEAEKAHHGHADENSICLLMHNETVLLHDSGYRERIPNGKYRADIYHNRIVARKGLPERKDSILDFLRDSGKYKPVETQKIDFITFREVDMSRTRVIDRNMGYQWDRVLIYLKRSDNFIIIDGIEILPEGDPEKTRPLTFSNLFYTRKILSRGEGYFDTWIDQIRGYRNPDRSALLICFPQHGEGGFWEGTDTTRRYYQKEKLIHQTVSKELKAGDMIAFVTVLIPHLKGADVKALVKNINVPEVSHYPRAIAVEIKKDDQKITLCVKLDLRMEILKENIRPRYNWESGAVRYGFVQTDAHFAYLKEGQKKLDYAFTEGTKIIYRGKEVFAAKEYGFPGQPDGEPMRKGVPKWRAWEGSMRISS